MAKAANPTVVGGFVLVAVALAVGGLLTFGTLSFSEEQFQMVSYFESSVSGLDVGAPVRFQGVQVGAVCGITAVWNDELENVQIPVELVLIKGAVKFQGPTEQEWNELESQLEKSVQRGLRAELRQDSFITGKLFVALIYAPESPVRRISDGSVYEMPTREGGFERLAKSIEDLPIDRLIDSAISAIEAIEVLAETPEINEVLQRVNRIAEGLEGSVQPTLQDIRDLITKIDTEFGAVAGDLRQLAQSADKLIQDADSQLGPLASAAATTMERAQGSLSELDQVLGAINGEIEPLMASTEATLAEVRETVGHVDALVGEDPTMIYRIGNLLEDMTTAARSVRALADYLERHPEALISGKD